MVATISRIRDAITSLFSHSNKIPFHKRPINSKNNLQVNQTRVHSCKPAEFNPHNSNASNNSFTTRAQVRNYNSAFISQFNYHANHLLQNNTAPASQIQPKHFNCNLTAKLENKINHITMSANGSSQTNPTTPPPNPRVTFCTQ